MNDLFVTDGLTDRDLINYAYTIRDKVSEKLQAGFRRVVFDMLLANQSASIEDSRD